MAQTGDNTAGCLSHTLLIGRFAKWAAISGVCAGCVFLLLPQVDLIVSRQFYLGAGQFSGQTSAAVSSARYAFMTLYFGLAAWTLLGLAIAVRRNKRWFGLSARQWVFAALCLAVGPGLIANQIFKDNWGRARPREVVAFEGQKPFTPPLVVAGNCARNCSFVSGEASSIFVIFFAAAALYRRRPRVLIAGGLVFGTVAGAIRVAQGAHFSSDVIFAGVFMALTVATLYFCFESRTAGGMGRVRISILGEAAAA